MLKIADFRIQKELICGYIPDGDYGIVVLVKGFGEKVLQFKSTAIREQVLRELDA